MTEEQRIHKIAEKRVKEWIEYAKKEYGWKNAQYDLFEEPMFKLCVQVAMLTTKELQEENERLVNDYEMMDNSFLIKENEVKRLQEQIVDLKDYVFKVSKFLHNNNNVKADKLVYKERDMLLVKELKLVEKWELEK